MWRVGMWYGDEKTTANGYLRSGAIALGAFVVTGIIFITLQRSMDAVNKRLTGVYGKANGDDAGASPTFAPNTTPINGPALNQYPATVPITPTYSPMTSYYIPPRTSLSLTPTGSSPVEPPHPNIPAAFTFFTNDGERYQARMAIADLRVTLQDFRDYNNSGLQKSLSGGSGSIQKTPSFDSGSNDGDATEMGQQTEIEKQRLAVDRVNSEVEALSAELSLTAHPDRFPETIRDQVGQVSRELRTYLQDVRYATALPSERSRLLSAASQHLSQGESALQDLQQIVDSGNTRVNIP